MKTNLLAILLFAGSGVCNAQFWNHTDPIKLEGTVNTEAEESIPVFSNDGSYLYFVRTFDGSNAGGDTDQDIWISKLNNGKYDNCSRLKTVNNKFNNAIVGFGGKGQTMYLLNSYNGKKDIHKGLAASSGSGDSWSNPEEVTIPGLDIDGDFYGFAISSDEKVIIISYAGPGSKGEEDLYVSTKSGGSWSTPKHMGAAINSAGFEISPFLSKTMDTLFFSSNGFGGLGDADIFYSVKQGDWTKWSAPVNMGDKINSDKFDAYFSHDGMNAYWSSNRDDKRSDIYMLSKIVPPPPPPISLACTGVDISTYGAKDGSIDAVVEGGVPPYTFEWSNGAATEDVNGLEKGEYTITVTDNVGQTATCSSPIAEPEPVDLTVVVEINEIKFDLDKWNIRPDAAKELDKIVEILNDNPKMVIELGSHTDCRGSAAYNKRLSEKRAKSSADYIKKRISNPDRITSKGYGETKLLNDCACEGDQESTCSDEQHQENRRTEFKIIEIGSDNIIIKNNSNNSFEH